MFRKFWKGDSKFEIQNLLRFESLEGSTLLGMHWLILNIFFDITSSHPIPIQELSESKLHFLHCFASTIHVRNFSLHSSISGWWRFHRKSIKKPGRCNKKVCWSRWKWKICFSCDHSHPRLIFPSLDFNLTISITCNLSTDWPGSHATSQRPFLRFAFAINKKAVAAGFVCEIKFHTLCFKGLARN